MNDALPDPLAFIECLLREQIGLKPETVGRDRIAQAVAVRQAACGQDLAGYLHLLHDSAEEKHALVDEVVVPETWFFRDRQAFHHLRRQVRGDRPQALAQKFRVLSVPCCTGEEPYSIAMVLLDAGLGAGDFVASSC